jgi:hypothetical protein
VKIDAVEALEERCLLAPVLSISPRLAAFTPDATLPANTNSGGVVVTLGQADTGFLTDAPFTSVTQLTPISSFGGDIVRIRSGPGGVFGNGLYAISRGAGENGLPPGSPQTPTTPPRTVTSAINRPGVIYRVDPATGKTNVFFDLNTVIPQLDPTQTSAANSAGAATGLVNWYDMTFDPDGYFDGRPSMFVTSVDRANAAKNAIYRIAPDGTFMGAFVLLTNGLASQKLTTNPSAVVIPPPEDQTFLRGLIAGGGISSTNGVFAALFFDSNQYSIAQNISGSTAASLPVGVKQTGLTLGPITGLTAANIDYASRVYSTFADFGTPAAGGIPGTPGLSGVQGINGELLINGGLFPANALTSTDSTITDRFPTATTDFRRFEDIAFDQYGYFTQGANVGTGTTTTGTNTGGSTGGTGAGGGSGTGVGQNLGAGIAGTIIVNNTVTSITLPPASAGNVFVADLGTGLSVPVTIPNTTPTVTVREPVQGPERISIVNPPTDPSGASAQITVTPEGDGLGGRIVRITPAGVVRNFAENFHTSNNLDSSSFQLSSLSISFSADGTTLYAADDDGVWQFKTTASLAGATSGSLIGLNDLRTLGVPYDGRDAAVAVIDTGVDATASPFRGRVAQGTNLVTGGFGNSDTATTATSTTTTGGGGVGGGGIGGGGAGGGTNGNNPVLFPGAAGHGTPIAGIIAQFVPQSTIDPVNIFAPFITPVAVTTTATGGVGGTTTGVSLTARTNGLSTANLLYYGLNYVSLHPFVNDPVRPNKTDRVIAAALGFGSTNTYNSETGAFKNFPQITISLKNQLKRLRHLGITPIAATGQFGTPLGNGVSTTGTTTGTTTTGTTTGQGNNNTDNINVGDAAGISLPAIFNEVVSVTGSYSYPFATGPAELPTNPPVGVANNLGGPIIVFGNTPAVGTSGGTTTTTTTTTTGTGLANIQQLINADDTAYTDRILGAANRNLVTDYTAPALDVPTVVRNIIVANTTTTGGGTGGGGVAGGGTGGSGTVGLNTGLGDNFDHWTFTQAGTSVSTGVVTGEFALVSSALNYWANLSPSGYTTSNYLTNPVGVRSLNFGQHTLLDTTAWNNPDGINSILQWTAVPALDSNDGLSVSTPKALRGSEFFRNISRASVSNAIAAIEGEIALQYLIGHNDLQYIDENHNGIITAQEVQDFVDNAAAHGMAEAGAMARLLGGTARDPANPDKSNPYGVNPTVTLFGERPDQPDVLQRRFNFFDFAANGQLNGGISIPSLNLLAHTLLPVPDAFVINDRQRASVDNYLLAPAALRDYHDLLFTLPQYQFISAPKFNKLKWHGISPAKFHVDRNLIPSASTFPVFELFDGNIKASEITNAPSKATTATSPAPATRPLNVNVGANTPLAGNSANAVTSSGDNAQAILAALTKLANGSNNSNPNPNVTVTQTPAQTSVAIKPSSSDVSVPIKTQRTLPTPPTGLTATSAQQPIGSVVTPVGNTIVPGTVVAPTGPIVARVAHHAAKKKSHGFFGNLTDSLKKAFH